MSVRTVRVTRLTRDLNEAIKDCKKSLKESKLCEDWPECLRLEGLIYAYEFVRDEFLNPIYDEQK